MAKNKKRSKPTKPRAPRRDFAQRLAIKLEESGLGSVEEGELGDNSGRWVNLRLGNISLCIGFDMKGEKIDRIGLYKDVIEVVDQKQIFSFDGDKKEK